MGRQRSLRDVVFAPNAVAAKVHEGKRLDSQTAASLTCLYFIYYCVCSVTVCCSERDWSKELS